MIDYPMDRKQCEFLRTQAKQNFDKVRSTWMDLLRWGLPHRGRWLFSQNPGERNNQHIVDGTHILAHRSYVAGFAEGNTSATRPWFRQGTPDPDLNEFDINKEWLDRLTTQTLKALLNCNFYHAAPVFYYDYGAVNTGSYHIDELDNGQLYFHVLIPGSYYPINNSMGEAVILVREMQMTVKSLVDYYGKKKNGMADWSNFSTHVKKCYTDGNYTQLIDVCVIIKKNDDFDPSQVVAGANRQWVTLAYEAGGGNAPYYQSESSGMGTTSEEDKEKYLSVTYSKRKPFIVGKSTPDFEYGEKGPLLDALGLIKSLNKKAIGKDQALEQMLRPAVQGPAALKKSYISTAANTYVPLDAHSLAQKGLRPIFEINPAIGAVIQDVSDMRQQVDRFFYADYLLYLSQNPKTRTAEETRAIVNEQQIVIGPNLQSLHYSHNVPVVEFVTDYVLENDPHLPPMPEDLGGHFLRPEFISVFAQAQKAADLGNIDRYIERMMGIGQIDPRIFDKVNLDRLADLYEDRLYLPAGLNREQGKVDAIRAKAQAQMARQAEMEQIALAAGAAKDMSQAKPQGVK